jgi:hypothetical protein
MIRFIYKTKSTSTLAFVEKLENKTFKKTLFIYLLEIILILYSANIQILQRKQNPLQQVWKLNREGILWKMNKQHTKHRYVQRSVFTRRKT